MRASSKLRVHVALSVLLISAPAILTSAHADGGPGHALAERFAAEAEKSERRAAERAVQQRQRQTDDELRRHEAEMLSRARAEALAREAAEREETNRRRAAELERLETERQAEEQRRQEAARIAEEKERTRLAAEAAARAAEERRLADQKADEERRQAAADAARREAQERERQAEADRISEALRQARDARERRREAEEREARQLLEEAERQAALPPPPPLPPAASPEAAPSPHEEATGSTRYAVLLVMQPGDRGIRRHNKTADPVLCSNQGCYISGGPASPAILMRQSKALGFGRTWGRRAGPCANALGCIFRDVEITSAGFLQPVDMRVVRHDRREAKTVEHGSRCAMVAGRLTCRAPMRGADYVMWLVPERLASEIGPAALERAVAEGLTEPEHARVDHPGWR